MDIGGSRFERAVLLGMAWAVAVAATTGDDQDHENQEAQFYVNLMVIFMRTPSFIYLLWQFVKIAWLERT
jgi:hypothetical protein